MQRYPKKKCQIDEAIKNCNNFILIRNYNIAKLSKNIKKICRNYIKKYGCLLNENEKCYECCILCENKDCDKYRYCQYFDVVMIDTKLGVDDARSRD